MSKAENLALKKYPEHSVLIVPARRGGYYADNHLREGFIEGYHQAEEDLALTCADVALLQTVFNAIDASITLGGLRVLPMTEEYYQEVLKRFHETKNNQ